MNISPRSLRPWASAVGGPLLTDGTSVYTIGATADIYTNGASANIYTIGATAGIYTIGVSAHIQTNGASAYVQTRSTFNLHDGTYTTTLSHAPTANRAIVFPDASGTVALTGAALASHAASHAIGGSDPVVVGQLGSVMTLSGSNSKGISLDATTRTVAQANTLAIMGGSVGVGTLTPGKPLEVAYTMPTAGSGGLRITNPTSSTASNFEFGVGGNTGFDRFGIISINGISAIQVMPTGQCIYRTGAQLPNSVSITGESNANAYVLLNDGSGVARYSCVTSTEYQVSSVTCGRWDAIGNFHVGPNNTGASWSGGRSLLTGDHARQRLHGQNSHAAGRFANTGDAQRCNYVLRNSTTDATPTTLFLNGSSLRLTVPAQSGWKFSADVIGYNSTDGIVAGFTIRGTIRRDNAGSTVIVGTNVADTAQTEGAMSGCVVTVTADDTNEALNIEVIGLAAKTIRWVAEVATREVSAGNPT